MLYLSCLYITATCVAGLLLTGQPFFLVGLAAAAVALYLEPES